MKPKMRFWNGFWWCRRMGVTGQGNTMKEAWNDMWLLYKEAVSPPAPKNWHEFYYIPNPRRG